MAKRRISGYEAAARAQAALDEEYYYEGNRLRLRYADDRPSQIPAFGIMFAIITAVVVFAVWLYPDIMPPITPQAAPAAPNGAIGNQAPPAAVRRAPAAPVSAPRAVATPIPGLAQNDATAQAQYDQAVQAGEQHAVPTAPPLPLNSAGEPIIDAAQQAQMQQSLTLAEQEGGQAADQQLAAQRATADADALSRPPDVSKEDAEQMMHRDLCSVPRANPATCASGLYKPTPVQ